MDLSTDELNSLGPKILILEQSEFHSPVDKFFFINFPARIHLLNSLVNVDLRSSKHRTFFV